MALPYRCPICRTKPMVPRIHRSRPDEVYWQCLEFGCDRIDQRHYTPACRSCRVLMEGRFATHENGLFWFCPRCRGRTEGKWTDHFEWRDNLWTQPKASAETRPVFAAGLSQAHAYRASIPEEKYCSDCDGFVPMRGCPLHDSDV